ncbi:MAG TPA: hypothetical protein VGH20_15390 [Myxococcales bacterium]|jgi:hypothetical protein
MESGIKYRGGMLDADGRSKALFRTTGRVFRFGTRQVFGSRDRGARGAPVTRGSPRKAKKNGVFHFGTRRDKGAN